MINIEGEAFRMIADIWTLELVINDFSGLEWVVVTKINMN